VHEKQPHQADRKWTRLNPNQASRWHHVECALDEVEISPTSQRCSVCKTTGRDWLRLLSADQSHQRDEVDEVLAPLESHQHLESLPHGARQAISRSRCAGGGASVARALQAGTLQAVGDGSLKGGFGTSAFALEAPGESRTQGVNAVPGPLPKETRIDANWPVCMQPCWRVKQHAKHTTSLKDKQ